MIFSEDGDVEFKDPLDGLTDLQRAKLYKGNVVGGRIKNPRSTKVIVSNSFEDAFKKMDPQTHPAKYILPLT